MVQCKCFISKAQGEEEKADPSSFALDIFSVYVLLSLCLHNSG